MSGRAKDPRVWEDTSMPSGPHVCPECGKALVVIESRWKNGAVTVHDFGTRCSECQFRRVPPKGLS